MVKTEHYDFPLAQPFMAGQSKIIAFPVRFNGLTTTPMAKAGQEGR